MKGVEFYTVPDIPDKRDLIYRPTVCPVTDTWEKGLDCLRILDQGQDGCSNGFALAAVLNLIDFNNNRQFHNRLRGPFSPRMLNEMATKFEEWTSDKFPYSSCRSVIKGWQNMGVCENTLWESEEKTTNCLNIQNTENAKKNKPKAYYRLKPNLADYHSAINETGAILVSANIHSGWGNPNSISSIIEIKFDSKECHAFAIVGYNHIGFWVQNSWGKSWGCGGVALWKYDDWYYNILDGWVVQFSVSTSQAFHEESTSRLTKVTSSPTEKNVWRSDIYGHFVNIVDGAFHDSGRFHTSHNDIMQARDKILDYPQIKHLLLYFHGGLNSAKDSAAHIKAMKGAFLDNGIYPFHFIYDTEILVELKKIISRRKQNRKFLNIFSRTWDNSLEASIRVQGRALWRELKRGAISAFSPNGAGLACLNTLIADLPTEIKLHVVGQSNGSNLAGYMLQSLFKQFPHQHVNSCILLAPSCSLTDYKNLYLPFLNISYNSCGIKNLVIFNLSDELEQNDSAGGEYRKSFLYLVSNALENRVQEPLVGMEKFSSQLHSQHVEFVYSEGKKGSEMGSQSESHDEFSKDGSTMNSILRLVLGEGNLPRATFTSKHLDF